MNRPRIIRDTLVLMSAGLLAMVASADALAVSWSQPAKLSSTATTGDVAALRGYALVAIVLDDGGDVDAPFALYAKRSTNSGASFKQTTLLAADAEFPSLHARGTKVDVVWVHHHRLRYTRSLDSGKSFESSVVLSPAGHPVFHTAVARHAGVVAVVWEDAQAQTVVVRVSRNGGASFGAPTTLASSSEQYGVAVAIAGGTINVAYVKGSTALRLRRSLDDGHSWKPERNIADDVDYTGVSISADANRAIVAWTAHAVASLPSYWRARYRTTGNGGATWSPARQFTPNAWSTAFPDVSLQNGVIRAVVERCDYDIDVCINQRVAYVESHDGESWSSAQRIAPAAAISESPHLTTGSRVVVEYSTNEGVFVRSGPS